MKTFTLIIALAFETLFAVETGLEMPPQQLEKHQPTSYKYIKLSDQWVFFPGLGIGYRSKDANRFHGFDADLTGYSYWDAGFSIYGKAHYLFYPRKEHFYLGIGGGVIGGWFSAHFGSGPLIRSTFGDGFFIKPTIEGILGGEWNTEKTPLFLQFELAGSYGAVPIYPAISFGIGF